MVALESIRSKMTTANQRTMASFRQSREERAAFARLARTIQSGVYRQNLLGNAGMLIAALTKRM
jgi:hypothetical protein